jgi:hypothetical protein
MTLRVKDLLNLPDAISSELEYRSTLKAQALAHRIVNKVTGNAMPRDPNVYNPYLDASGSSGSSGSARSTGGDASQTDWDKNSKSGWGRNGNW